MLQFLMQLCLWRATGVSHRIQRPSVAHARCSMPARMPVFVSKAITPPFRNLFAGTSEQFPRTDVFGSTVQVAGAGRRGERLLTTVAASRIDRDVHCSAQPAEPMGDNAEAAACMMCCAGVVLSWRCAASGEWQASQEVCVVPTKPQPCGRGLAEGKRKEKRGSCGAVREQSRERQAHESSIGQKIKLCL